MGVTSRSGRAAALACGLANLAGCSWLTVSEPSRPAPPERAPAFEAIEVDFAHAWDRENTHHLTGAAVLDLEGDGAEEVFVGGGRGQPDALLGLRDGRLVALPDDRGLSSEAATYGALSIDWDGDGDPDLFVCREDGLTLYRNESGRFRSERIPLDLPPESVPLAVTAGDVEGDGDGDLYVSVFIDGPQLRSATYNDPAHAKPNRLLLGDGVSGFRDATDPVTASLQNSFTSALVDLDADGLPEIVIAQNTGEIEILANRGGARFERVPVDSGYGFWMGLAIGDVDADGDPDLFFSNVGNSIPDLFTRGDLRDEQRYEPEWLLLRNDGALRFENATAEAGLTGYGFSWGALFEDLDLDGRLDLLVAQNYVKWPLHRLRKLPGKALLDVSDGAPRYRSTTGLEDPAFAQSPLMADLDGDARLDVVWLNNDAPSRAYLNRTRRPFLHVALPDDLDSTGARIRLEGMAGSVTHWTANGTGLGTDSTISRVFGLPEGTARVEAVVVEWPDGRSLRVPDPPLNQRLGLAPPE